MCTKSLVNEMERTYRLMLLIGFLANFFSVSLFAHDVAQKISPELGWIRQIKSLQ